MMMHKDHAKNRYDVHVNGNYGILHDYPTRYLHLEKNFPLSAFFVNILLKMNADL